MLTKQKTNQIGCLFVNSGKIKLSGEATRGRGGPCSSGKILNFFCNILYHDKRGHIEPSTDSTIWISKPAGSITIFHNYIWGQGIFHTAAPKLWNSLPVTFKDIDSLDIFKTKVKTYLFRDAYF